MTDGELVRDACDELLEPGVLKRYTINVFINGMVLGSAIASFIIMLMIRFGI